MDWFREQLTNRDSLIVLFTGATVLAAAVALLLTYNSHQHSKVDSGRKKPIRVGHPRFDPWFYPGGWREFDDLQPQGVAVRRSNIRLFNRSAVSQTVTFVTWQVLWPRKYKTFYKWYAGQEVEVPPHSGGSFPVYVANFEWLDESEARKEQLSLDHEYRCLTYVRLHTASGHNIRWIGMLDYGLTVYRPELGNRTRKSAFSSPNESSAPT